MMLAELQNIYKSYDHPVLEGITLEVPEGETLAVTGPSGSGKSTLLNILGTLDRPDRGELRLEGRPIHHLTDNQLAGIRNRVIGFVFQRHHLLPQLTVLENVLLPTIPPGGLSARDAVARAMRLLERVGLAGQIHQRPGTLSVGESQRAAVVRALINGPKLLLADEPTGSLDTAGAGLLGDLLLELNREEGMAVVVVTHTLSLAEKMHRLYHLESGKLVREKGV